VRLAGLKKSRLSDADSYYQLERGKKSSAACIILIFIIVVISTGVFIYSLILIGVPRACFDTLKIFALKNSEE